MDRARPSRGRQANVGRTLLPHSMFSLRFFQKDILSEGVVNELETVFGPKETQRQQKKKRLRSDGDLTELGAY